MTLGRSMIQPLTMSLSGSSDTASAIPSSFQLYKSLDEYTCTPNLRAIARLARYLMLTKPIIGIAMKQHPSAMRINVDT